jgi:DNA-binding NarL/FixJ family response regulator
MDLRHKGDVDGVKTAAAIHALCGSGIVFVTAYADDPIASRRMREIRPTAIISKPARPEAILEAVNAAIG